MAKVPDLGSDFAQKLLRDLRRRREHLGFEESAAAPVKSGAAPTAAAPRARDAYSNARKPPQVQKPQQAAAAAPRVATRSQAAATTSISRRQGNSSSIARPGTPRRHDAPAVAHSNAIVPFQGGAGRGGGKQTAAPAAGGVDVQMALALALSNSGKLQNVHLVARQGGGGGSMFFGEPGRTGTTASQAQHHLLAPGAHVGKVAISVQKLNDILVAYSSGGAGAAGVRRGSVEIGKQLLRGAMDLEESLSMLMMLQDASDYMEMGNSGNGGGKVLLLEGKEGSWKSSAAPRSTTSAASARLVEIVDGDSEETDDDAKSPSDAFMQIVPHGGMPQSYRPSHFAGAANNCKRSNATSGDRDGSKVRMPSLIAKLMGLENLPSAKTAAERKGTERFVKPEAVPRKSTAANVMPSTLPLPIRIIASERMPSRGQMKNFQTREWNISLTKSEEPVLSSRFSHLTVDKQTRQTMGQMLSKQEGTDRRVSVNQVADEKIVHQDTKLTEEDSSKQKTTVSAGRKMNFLQRFRKNGQNKLATEEKAIVEENKPKLGKKQTTSIKHRESEMKPRKTREKFNKENLANPGNKTQGKNSKAAKTDQMRKQAQSKPSDKLTMEKKVQNYRRVRTETAIQNREQKRSLKSEPTHTKEKIESVTLTELQNGEGTKVDDTRSHKPSDNTPGDDGLCEQSAAEMEDSRTTREALPYQSEKELTEEINDPTTAVAQTTPELIAETNDDRVNHAVNETIQTLETFSKEEQQHQQEQQMKEVNHESTNGLDHIVKPSHPYDLKNHKMDVVSCDSFTENQLLLAEMLLKDPYLLETAKAIIGFHLPVSVVQVNTGKWLDKGNEVLSDIGREVIRRKGKRTEAIVDVSMTRIANLKLQTLDDLIRELDSDIQSLPIPKKIQQQSGHSTAENLKMVLRSDMENLHSDANSTWDFGWNRVWDLPIEKNEVVRDLEKNMLGGIITDVARELIDVSLRHGCCACES